MAIVKYEVIFNRRAIGYGPTTPLVNAVAIGGLDIRLVEMLLIHGKVKCCVP